LLKLSADHLGRCGEIKGISVQFEKPVIDNRSNGPLLRFRGRCDVDAPVSSILLEPICYWKRPKHEDVQKQPCPDFCSRNRSGSIRDAVETESSGAGSS